MMMMMKSGYVRFVWFKLHLVSFRLVRFPYILLCSVWINVVKFRFVTLRYFHVTFRHVREFSLFR